MHKLIIHCILASSFFSPLAYGTELNPLRPHRINSRVNDTFSCVCYRDSLALASDPVLYVIGTSGSRVQFAEAFGHNLDVETPDGELRVYQSMGGAGHSIAEGISHQGTRLSTLIFLSNNHGLMPVSVVKEISVDRSMSAIQRAFAGLALANAGDPSAEPVLNELSLSEDEEVRDVAEDGLFMISNTGNFGE